MSVTVHLVRAFTHDGQGGNPAGVVLDADGLDAERMQEIAASVGFSETAFVRSNPVVDHDVRFFTPHTEVALCGHGTVATYAVLAAQGTPPGTWRMRTPAGIQRVVLQDDGLVTMTQNPPRFGPQLQAERIAAALGVAVSEIGDSTPIQVVSTGLDKIHCPITSRQVLDGIAPDYGAIGALARETDSTGIFAFTLETITGAAARCRNFSSVVGGEDPATGTACAGLSCLLFSSGVVRQADLVFEQGYSIGRPSQIRTHLVAHGDHIEEVLVSGRATIDGDRSVS